MENTLENKAKFFALYWGQDVFTDPDWENGRPYKLDAIIRLRTASLQLRPLESLNQTECLYIADIFDLTEEVIRDTDLLEWIEALFTESAGYYIDGYTATEVQHLVDYLRSIGILIPFMGLSCQQILDYGWVRIKEGK